MYAVYDSTGRLVSTGTVVADPLPAGLTARLLTDQEAAWLADGGQWDAASRLVREPVPVVPDSVTPWQIRRWLLLRGVIPAAVDAMIDAVPDAAEREALRVDWEYAAFVERSHPMLEPMAAALGITDLDAAFVEAARLGT
jgi:hypothetical protein